MRDNLNNFNLNGYLVIRNFLNLKNFDKICKNLDLEISEMLKEKSISKLGGYKIGNLNVHPGKYSNQILNEMKMNKFLELIEETTSLSQDDIIISVGGNLCLPKKYDQNFHTDGNFKQKMIIASIATSDVNINNGPTEIVLDGHDKDLPYWKFLFQKKRKKKILLKKGDLIIRKHSLWHRGTRNNSDKFRFLMAFTIFDKSTNIKSNIEDSDQIRIFENFFGNSKIDRFKELIYLKFNFLYVFYKALLSIRKNN